jgi:hypothetical protein
VNKG